MTDQQTDLARRRFLGSGVLNLSALATAWLLDRERAQAEPAKPDLDRVSFDLRPKPTHRPPRATAMISMFMQGGPSQMDLLDPKPELNRLGRPEVSGHDQVRQRRPGQFTRSSDHPGSSASMVRQASISPSCCRILATSPTTFWSSARCIPASTIMANRFTP